MNKKMVKLFPEIEEVIIRKVVNNPNIKEVICFDDKRQTSLWMNLHVNELVKLRDEINNFLGDSRNFPLEE